MTRGTLGTWSPLALWQAEPNHGRDAAAELEDLGYETIWLGNGQDILSVAESLLAATRTVTVATGILNIWLHQDPAGVARIVRGSRHASLAGSCSDSAPARGPRRRPPSPATGQ